MIYIYIYIYIYICVCVCVGGVFVDNMKLFRPDKIRIKIFVRNCSFTPLH